MARPNLRDLKDNWSQAEGSGREKLRRAAANFAIKFRTRANCCGNHGDVGCCIGSADRLGDDHPHSH